MRTISSRGPYEILVHDGYAIIAIAMTADTTRLMRTAVRDDVTAAIMRFPLATVGASKLSVLVDMFQSSSSDNCQIVLDIVAEYACFFGRIATCWPKDRMELAARQKEQNIFCNSFVRASDAIAWLII